MNCDCIERIDAKLIDAGNNYRLATTLLFDNRMGIDVQLSIGTTWIGEPPRGKKHKSPPGIICTFCPFCGIKTAKEEAEAAS